MSDLHIPTLREIMVRVHLRVILFAVLLAAASLAISGGLVIRNYAQRNLDLVARTLAYTVEPAVMFDDHRAIMEGIASVASGGNVQQVEVFDQAGRLLARWENPHMTLPEWLLNAADRLLWRRTIMEPLVFHGSRVGEVRILGNPEGLVRFVLAGLIIAICSLVLTVVAARILASRLQSAVIGPLEHFAEVTRKVRAERLFHYRLPQAGIAEIDRIGDDFNHLIGELQQWHQSQQAKQQDPQD